MTAPRTCRACGIAFAYGSQDVQAFVMMGASLTALVIGFRSVLRG